MMFLTELQVKTEPAFRNWKIPKFGDFLAQKKLSRVRIMLENGPIFLALIHQKTDF
jgi:hypothetical protein